jgi:hypothetical protein
MAHIRLPKIVAWREISVDGQNTRYTYDGEVPMEVLNQAGDLLGGGAARVSVSQDMSLKEFGSGAAAGVTISLSCEQSDTVIAQAVGLAGYWAREYVKQQLELADQEYQTLAAQKKAAKAAGSAGSIPSGYITPAPFSPGSK